MSKWEFGPLCPEEFEDWVALCGSIFEVGPDYFRRHYENDPHRFLASIFVCRDEGTLVSSVRVFHRQVWLDGHPVSMAGIGEVCTLPAYRGVGISRKLLDLAMDYMRREGFVLSLLSTTFFSHYAHQNFQQVSSYRKKVRKPKITATPLRPLDVTSFAEMASLYERYSKKAPLSMVRTDDYWRSWCRGEMGEALGLYKDDGLVGYVCYRDSVVTELIAASEDQAFLLAGIPAPESVLDVPAFVETSEVLSSYVVDTNMVTLLQPIVCYGRRVEDTASLVETLEAVGGICLWGQDAF